MLNAVRVSHSASQKHGLTLFIKTVKTNKQTKTALRLSRGLRIRGESFRTVETALRPPHPGLITTLSRV